MQTPLRGHTLQLCPRAQADRETHQARSSVVFTSLRPWVLSADPPAAPSAGPLKMIFMKESEASNFFRRRSRRGLKSQDEINGEFTHPGCVLLNTLDVRKISKQSHEKWFSLVLKAAREEMYVFSWTHQLSARSTLLMINYQNYASGHYCFIFTVI